MPAKRDDARVPIDFAKFEQWLRGRAFERDQLPTLAPSDLLSYAQITSWQYERLREAERLQAQQLKRAHSLVHKLLAALPAARRKGFEAGMLATYLREHQRLQAAVGLKRAQLKGARKSARSRRETARDAAEEIFSDASRLLQQGRPKREIAGILAREHRSNRKASVESRKRHIRNVLKQHPSGLWGGKASKRT
jgi:hypothetical protein